MIKYLHMVVFTTGYYNKVFNTNVIINIKIHVVMQGRGLFAAVNNCFI